MKKLYLIQRNDPDRWQWEEYLGFVIAAVSKKRALSLMAQHSAGVEWNAEYIGVSNRQKEGIILSSFQAA